MADLSHELGALRMIVDSPLSSKVAMFNNQVAQHKTSQLLNPFSQTDGGRVSPKPDITKDDYGKPLAGSLTEMRGQKANMHVMREMLELCQIIDSEGYDVKDEQNMRVITFGELFNIYNYISDKCVGILLRARKHKLVEFEGEMLFQRRDDNVPIFLLKPIVEIRHELNDKIECIKRAGSPAPQATSLILDKKANGLGVPASRKSASRTPSPQSSKSSSPVKETKPTETPAAAPSSPAAPTPVSSPLPAPVATNKETPKIKIIGEAAAPETKIETTANIQAQNEQAPQDIKEAAVATNKEAPKLQTIGEAAKETKIETSATKQAQNEQPPQDIKEAAAPTEVKAETAPQLTNAVTEAATNAVNETQSTSVEQPAPAAEVSDDLNKNAEDLPTVVIEATAVYRRPSAPSAEVNANPAPEAPVV